MSYFFGVKLDHLPNGILLTQRKYISNLLQKTSLSGANSVSSLMVASVSLLKFDSPTFDNSTLFHSIIGNLQYLFHTWPNIFLFVNKVGQFMHEPKISH